MPIYESIAILKSTLSDEDVQKVSAKIEGIVKKDGELLALENWGKKKLAYDVQKEKRGIYLLFRFKGGGSNIPELERGYRFEDNVIKFMTVKLGKKMAAHVEKVKAQAEQPQGTAAGKSAAPEAPSTESSAGVPAAG